MWTRTVSGLVLAAAALGLLWHGGWWFYAAVALCLSLGALEFAHLMRRGGFAPPAFFAIALIVCVMADALFPGRGVLMPAVAFVLLGSLAWQLGHRGGAPTADWALAVAAGMYLGVAGAHAVALRQLGAGERWLALTLAGTWLADSAAYVVGSRLGRHQLTPLLSPNKTWEGLAGGMVAGPLLNTAAAALLGLPLAAGAVLGWIGAGVGLFGDLAVSMMKRQVHAKDSGRLIPGHGGVLDRLDSVLFSVIVGYYYVAWVVLQSPAG